MAHAMRSVNNCVESDPDVPGGDGAPAGPRELSSRRAPMIGLIGVLIAFVAIASLFALQQPPFVGADEKAHLGYAYEIADGALPTIDTRMPVPVWADQWMSETIYTHFDQNRTIWVANHPPLFYMSVAPLVWFSEATERPDGGLLLLRMANIAYGALGIVFTYALAKELTKSAHLALLSAAAAAMVTQFYASLSLGMSDGLTFAAGAAATWAGLRCLQRGPTRANLAILSAVTVISTGARAVTMLIAFAVVFIVAVFEFRDRRAPTRERWRAAGRICVIGVLPAAVAFGWFYVRNMILYGDIGASTYLLERFDRAPNGSVVSSLLDMQMWRSLFFRSMSPVTYRGASPPWMLLVAAVALGGLAMVVATRRSGDRDRGGERYPIARRSVLLLLVGVAVIVWYIAEHVSGGGYLHPRYAFPVMGSLATLMIVGLDRIAPRFLPTAVLVGMGAWTLSHLPVGIDVSASSRPRDAGRLAPLALRALPGDESWRALAGAGIVVGCVVACVALVILMTGPRDLDRSPPAV